jgi:hypothetical protein
MDPLLGSPGSKLAPEVTTTLPIWALTAEQVPQTNNNI